MAEPTVENGGLWARCPACMGNIAECGDCGTFLAAIAPKPEDYVDAPQWQQEVWDSMVDEAGRRRGGWCAPSEVIHGYQNADFILPELSVPRGGIGFPRFTVETFVDWRRPHWWKRKVWRLHTRYMHEGVYQHDVLEFDKKHKADLVKKTTDLLVKSINGTYAEEKRKNAR